MTDKAALQRLVAEAMAETPDPRAGRCWFTHRWSMWQTGVFVRQFGEPLQHRRCCRCGKWRVATLTSIEIVTHYRRVS